MLLRLLPTIVPSVCALALAAHGYLGACSGHLISPPDGNALVVDDHAETVGRTVISALAAGQVTSIEVHDNEQVSRGQPLFRIDDHRYQLAVAVAQAELAASQHRTMALRTVYRQHVAGLAAAEEFLAYQQHAHDIQTQLLSRGVISQLEFDQRTVTFLDARDRVVAEQCAIAETLADLDNDPDLPIDQHPAVEKAKAELDRAELDLSEAVVTAPEDGIVINVDRLRVGEYVQVGTAVFYLAYPSRHSRL
jgi:membrane fusion protein, multidrug efflux system